MDVVVSEYNFFLNSYYRQSGTNASPEFILDEAINLKNPNNYFKAFIKSVDIPYSFKTINSSNNTLNIGIYHNVAYVPQAPQPPLPQPQPTLYSIALTPGNYNAITILQELEIRLKEKCVLISANDVPDFPSTYDRDTGKMTLQIRKKQGSGNHSWQIYLYWYQNNGDLLADFFGFDPVLNPPNFTTSLFCNNANPNGIYINNVSLYNVNLSPITSLYIRSSSLGQQSNNQEWLVSAKESVSDILLKVPINSFPGSWIIYENTLNIGFRLNNKTIDKIELYLTDGETYSPLSLLNVHWKAHLYIEEYQPEFVTNALRLEAEKNRKIRELEEMKNNLIDELFNTTQELKTNIKPQVEQHQKTIEEMKKQFIDTVEKSRADKLKDFFNPTII